MLSQCNIGAVVLFVSNLERSLSFYRDTLGLPVRAAEGHDGPYGIGQVGAMHLVLIVREARIGESPIIVFSLEGGIDDYAEALADRGVEIVVPVSEAPDGGLTLDFVDPDRNAWSLYQPAGAPRRR